MNLEAYLIANGIPGTDTDIICGLAKKYSIMFAIRLAEKGGMNLYDSAVLIDARGEILLKHGKKLERLVKRVTKEMNTHVIGTDLVGEITNGQWTGYIYDGQSVIVEKMGVLLAVGKDREPDILIQDLVL